MKKIFFLNIAIFIALLSAICGCKKLVEVSAPVTSINAQNVFNTDATAVAVLTGIYADYSNSGLTLGKPNSLTLYAGLSADEFTLFSGGVQDPLKIAYYKNALYANSSGGVGSDYWSSMYTYIFKCNDAIANLSNANSLTPVVQKQLLGEAKFFRAFCFFYLTNLYGDIPLTLTTDYKANATLGKTTQANVYQQIISDLKDAQQLLSKNFIDGTLLNASPERVRPTAWAATALLARTYLYSKDYTDAEVQASSIISNNYLFALNNNINNVFLKASLGNNEPIWQLQVINSSNNNTDDAQRFVIPSAGPLAAGNIGVLVSNSLLGAFEPGDNRKSYWIGSTTVAGNTYYYPFKYKAAPSQPNTEYYMVLRLAEQYLIRAEARAQQGKLTGAASDLNIVRNRAGIPNTNATNSQSQLLTAIQHERQIEFFAELGHRWLDLKRTGTVDAVMGSGGGCSAKGGTWNTNWQLYPIYYQDIQLDNNLKQNAGY